MLGWRFAIVRPRQADSNLGNQAQDAIRKTLQPKYSEVCEAPLQDMVGRRAETTSLYYTDKFIHSFIHSFLRLI